MPQWKPEDDALFAELCRRAEQQSRDAALRAAPAPPPPSPTGTGRASAPAPPAAGGGASPRPSAQPPVLSRRPTLDQETLFTINKFFENNLNVSETSRKLFVHRNTLVYRLEKIKKLTGLDLREFDDAIIFKVALMVKKYLVSRENRII